MANWLDDVEKKKREEDERFRAKLADDVKKYKEEHEAREKLYASLKPRFDPIFLKLETLVERANKNGFFLIAQRGEYSHELKIFRYNAEHDRVDVRRGELKMWKEIERARGNEEYLKGVAEITLYPKSEGVQIWFTETDISMGWKGGKWYDKEQISGSSKLRECVGTASYESLSEEKLLELIKWIATGKEPIPRFRNVVIPYKAWEPPKRDTPRGCLFSPWTYAIPIGILLLIIYLSSVGRC